MPCIIQVMLKKATPKQATVSGTALVSDLPEMRNSGQVLFNKVRECPACHKTVCEKLENDLP